MWMLITVKVQYSGILRRKELRCFIFLTMSSVVLGQVAEARATNDKLARQRNSADRAGIPAKKLVSFLRSRN